MTCSKGFRFRPVNAAAIFIYQPALFILGGDYSPLIILQSIGTTVLGLVCFSAAFEGWLLTRVPIWQQLLLIAAGIVLVLPAVKMFGGFGWTVIIGGLGVLVFVVLLQLLSRRRIGERA